MTTEANDGQKRIKKYILENATPEVNPIPKKEDEKLTTETPKEERKQSDEYNEYEYSENKDEDDTKW